MSSLALVACEEPRVREEISLALEGLSCDVESVATIADVLHRLGTDDPPGVLVLDPLIPGGDHPELPARLRTVSPSTVVVIMVDPERSPEGLPLVGSAAIFRFLLRPWTEDELHGALREALGRAGLLAENRRLADLHEMQQQVLREETERLTRLVDQTTSEVQAIERERASRPGSGDAAALASAIIEAYDTGLALHARAVSSASRDLAHSLGLPEDTVDRVQVAGMLHDIGYLGLPRFFLKRSLSRLTDREREERETHPLLGEQVLGVDEGLVDVARLVRFHHENFDGTGFPDGVRGEGIPIGSRIIHLADTYDRAYRRGAVDGGPAARTRARLALKDARGKALDADLVDLFLDGAALRADTREVQIHIEELRDGMVLTRDLRARNDLFIAAGGTRLDQSHIEKILTFHGKNPILHEVFVRTS